jgi:biopolymer transport protein ExbB/TolQ
MSMKNMFATLQDTHKWRRIRLEGTNLSERKNKGRTRKSDAAFQVNNFYEKLLDLRRTNPKAFGEMSPASKLSLLAYETAKREAERLEALRDEPQSA